MKKYQKPTLKVDFMCEKDILTFSQETFNADESQDTFFEFPW